MLKLKADELKVLNILQSAQSATPLKKIKELTGLSERRIKEVIETLIFNHDIAIVARRGKVHGYYIAKSREELESGLKEFKQQIRTSELRLRKLMSIEF